MKSNGTTREPRRRILIPLVIGCAFFMEGLDSTMIAVAIPDMAESLGEHPLRLNLVITTYLLSLAVFIPFSGWIADPLGARLGDELDDDPGDDRADRGADRRRFSDDLLLVARDLLSQRPDRHRRFRAGPLLDRQLPGAGPD